MVRIKPPGRFKDHSDGYAVFYPYIKEVIYFQETIDSQFARGAFHSKMVQPSTACSHAATNLTQAVRLGQLTKYPRHRMDKIVKGLFSSVAIIFYHDFFKFSLQDQIQHLTKQTCGCILYDGASLFFGRASIIYCYGQVGSTFFILF